MIRTLVQDALEKFLKRKRLHLKEKAITRTASLAKVANTSCLSRQLSSTEMTFIAKLVMSICRPMLKITTWIGLLFSL